MDVRIAAFEGNAIERDRQSELIVLMAPAGAGNFVELTTQEMTAYLLLVCRRVPEMRIGVI